MTTDNQAIVKVIHANRDRYFISAVRSVLKIPRSTYYKHLKSLETKPKGDGYTDLVVEIFRASRNTYGTRRIKKEIINQTGKQLSRRRIAHIMKENGLVSVYQVKKAGPQKSKVNDAKVQNKLSKEFDNKAPLEVIVSDLTYVRVKDNWHYVCFILDLSNREIIGYSAGANKTAELVSRAFANANCNLEDVKLFHRDLGSEFKNEAIDKMLTVFNIDRSLSKKGCPYDNAVSEATYKTFKTEFVYPNAFDSLEELEPLLSDYVHWYNHIRLHSSLGYMSPVEYKNLHLNNFV